MCHIACIWQKSPRADRYTLAAPLRHVVTIRSRRQGLVRGWTQIAGIVLSNLVDFFNPEIIVLGGGLTDDVPKLSEKEVLAGIEAHSTAEARRGLRVAIYFFLGFFCLFFGTSQRAISMSMS